MNTRTSLLGAATTAALAIAIALSASAPVEAQTYPAGPGVATVSVANGNVIIIRGDNAQQFAATINSPVQVGDYIATGTDSTAEIQFDGVSMLRLAPNSQVRLVNLNWGAREAQLAAGTVDLAELQGSTGSPQIDTPSLSVRPSQSGDTRVSVLPNGQTLVTVRSGAATVASGAGTQTLSPGTTLVASGPYNNPAIAMQGAIAWDSFDQFNGSRDQSIQAAYNSNQYLSPQLAGYSNLANYGTWQDVPGYGYSWSPSNQTNWAPYQNGQWVWQPGYGYTWVGNEQWGYAPYHYGNWYYNQSYNGWNWQPPAYGTQTTSGLASAWLPALVSFFLTGSNATDSAGLLGGLLGGTSGYPNYYNNANIGWIPLAPGEAYQPWYGANQTYPATTVTNITNITNVYRYYRNARNPRGIVMVPVNQWRAGNFHHVVYLQPAQARQIVLLRGGIPVVPTNANLRYSQTASVKHQVTVSKTFETQRFVAKAPHVTHFTTQQAQVQKVASVKPKTVALPKQTAATPPVYHPENRPPVHAVPIAKPPAHPAPMPKPPSSHPAPAPKPPVTHPAPIATAHPVHPPAAVPPRPIETVRPIPVNTVRPRPIVTMAPAHPVPPASQPHPVTTVRAPAPATPVHPHPAPPQQQAHPPVQPHPAPSQAHPPQQHPVPPPKPKPQQSQPKPAPPPKDQPKPADHASDAPK